MSIVTILQIITSVIIIGLILMQERSSGTSGIFGGGGESGYYQTRRGLEKGIFIATIIFVLVFAGLSLLNLVV